MDRWLILTAEWRTCSSVNSWLVDNDRNSFWLADGGRQLLHTKLHKQNYALEEFCTRPPSKSSAIEKTLKGFKILRWHFRKTHTNVSLSLFSLSLMCSGVLLNPAFERNHHKHWRGFESGSERITCTIIKNSLEAHDIIDYLHVQTPVPDEPPCPQDAHCRQMLSERESLGIANQTIISSSRIDFGDYSRFCSHGEVRGPRKSRWLSYLRSPLRSPGHQQAMVGSTAYAGRRPCLSSQRGRFSTWLYKKKCGVKKCEESQRIWEFTEL